MSHADVTEPPAALVSLHDPTHGLMECLAEYLAPLFASNTDDGPAARFMAIRAILSYRPEMKADFITVARSIAFSMSALSALNRAATEDMPPALRLRYFSVANALSRSADQSERTMERRGRRFAAQQSGDAEGTAEHPEPDDPGLFGLAKEELEAGEAAIHAAVAEAMLEYTSGCRTGAPSAEASAGPQDVPVPDPTSSNAASEDGEAIEEPIPGSRDVSPRQRDAKRELAAIISGSEQLGAARQRERGFERNPDAQQGVAQAPTSEEQVRPPYGREAATMHLQVPA